MEVVGWVATVIVALLLMVGLVIGVRSLPDVQRYLKMRQM